MRRCEESFKVRAWGPLACFTRPEFKVERVSYEVMTPSAARGVLEAVHWKPAIRWVVTAIHVLAEVKFISVKRNEVGGRVSTQTANQGMRGEPIEAYFADDNRQQRNTLALRNVNYVIEAHFETTAKWGPEDTIPKHVETFRRRLEKGQTFHQPYLGCREFAAAVEPVEVIPPSELPEVWADRPLGLMLHDFEYGPVTTPRFFNAQLKHGVLRVPPFASAVALASTEVGP